RLTLRPKEPIWSLLPMTESGYDIALRLATHLMQCASLAHGRIASPPKIIDRVVTWNIGTLTIMLRVETDEVYLAGTDWQAGIQPKGAIKLTGAVAGNVDDEWIAVKYREMLTLVIAACTEQKYVQGGETNV